MEKQNRTNLSYNFAIIPCIAIIFGLLLNLIISVISEDFFWRFFRIAIFNSTFLGLTMLVSGFFTRHFLFRIKHLTIMFLSSLIVLGAGTVSLFLIISFDPTIFLYYSNGMITYLLINILFILTLNVITTGFSIYQGIILENEKSLNDERYLKKEVELKLLAARLNPHFLFNSLNLIISLLKKPEKAEDALITLSELLRFNLDFSEMPRIPISSELEGVKKYLELQKMRFEERLEYEINCNINIELPPLLIQPLVENSINHNIKNTEQVKISIDVEKDNTQLIITVIDSCKKVNPSMLNKGTGLTTTKKRVENYGGNFLIQDGGIKIIFDYD